MFVSVSIKLSIFQRRGNRVLQGGTLMFSYIRRLGPFLEVQNFEFQYFLGFQKNEYFSGMKVLWISLRYLCGVITKLDHFKWSFLCSLGSFLMVKVHNGG